MTSEQRAAARHLAVDAGLTIETRDDQASLSTLRSGATAAGMLLALGVVMLGVLLGTAGAYLMLIGVYLGHLGELGRVPVAHLGVIALGVPLIAAVAGWLLAGREPPALARAALE